MFACEGRCNPQSVTMQRVCLLEAHRHCKDSAGSSPPLVLARSRFLPTVGRQALLAVRLAFNG